MRVVVVDGRRTEGRRITPRVMVMAHPRSTPWRRLQLNAPRFARVLAKILEEGRAGHEAHLRDCHSRNPSVRAVCWPEFLRRLRRAG